MTDHPTWTYDPLAHAGYLRLGDGPRRKTHRLNDVVLIDLDADGAIVGIEILNVDTDPKL